MRSLSNTTKSSRKTRRISVFQRLSYGTNPPANGDSKPIQSANARRRDSTSNMMFLVSHVRRGNLDHSVITTENNKNSFTFRLVPDDYDFPHNLLSLIRVENYTPPVFSGYPVMGSCDSYIWVLCAQNPHPYDILWDMAASRPIGYYPSVFPTMNDEWLSGFGFDPLSGDYKAVRCWMNEDFSPIKKVYAEVLSLRTGSWKEIRYTYNTSSVIVALRSSSICVNGFHYWLVNARSRFTIMSFDFSNEMFCDDLIHLPKEEKLCKLLRVTLVEFHGSLAVIFCDEEDDYCFTFEIWAWRNESNWFLVSTFDVPASAAPRKVLGLYKNEKLFFQDSKGDLLLYDCATRDLENLGIHDDRDIAQVFPYIKSSVGPVSCPSVKRKYN